MAEHENESKTSNGNTDQKHRVRQTKSQPQIGQYHSWDQTPSSLSETPFHPQMDKHAEFLAFASPSPHSTNFILQLQQTYGNRYVHHLVESMNVQAKLAVSQPDDVYEQEADRVAETVTRNTGPSTQRQEEEEEMAQPKMILQRQEEEEMPVQMGISYLQRQEIPEEEEAQTKPAASIQRQTKDINSSIKTANYATGSVLHSSKLANTPIIQRAWDKEKVNNNLGKDPMGKDAVKDLNDQNYKVIKIEQYKFTRQLYTKTPYVEENKAGEPIPMERNGWHSRGKLEIAISNNRNDKQAASTLVHEVTHANQHKANEEALLEDQNLEKENLPFPDVLSKEVDAHVKQAKFNKAAGIPQKQKNFVIKEGPKKGQIDENAIEKYVKKVYKIGQDNQRLPFQDTKPEVTIIETIKPWPEIA